MNTILNKGHLRITFLYLGMLLGACAAPNIKEMNAGGARGLLKSVPEFKSAVVVDIASKDTLYQFSLPQLDSLKKALHAAFYSDGLILTPAAWDVALVLKSESGPGYVALYIGHVLRVNTNHPWSALIADSLGDFPAPGIGDIVLDSDDVPWLFDFMEQVVGKPPSKSYQIPKMPPLLHMK